MGSRFVASTVSGLLACTPEAAPDPKTPAPVEASPARPRAAAETGSAPTVTDDPAADVGTHVLIGHGTELFTAPHQDAATAVMHLARSTLGAVPRVRTLEVLGAEGGFLAVRAAQPRSRCTRGIPGLSSLALDLWIRPESLKPVITEKTNTTAPDGDGVTLWPGTPIARDGTITSVELLGARWALTLAADHVGHRFTPIALPDAETMRGVLGEGPTLTWGGEIVPERALLGNPPAASALVDNADHVLVFSRCAAFTAHNSGARPILRRPDAEKQLPSGVVAMPSRDGPTWKTAPGQPVYWPGGRAAGTTRAAQTFVDAPKRVGERACFRVSLMERGLHKRLPPDDTWLEFCVDASSVSSG